MVVLTPSTMNSSSAQRRAGDGLFAVAAPDHELAEQGVVVRRHRVARVDVGVERTPGPPGATRR